MPKNMREVLNNFLTAETPDYNNFLKNLDKLSQEQITEILGMEDLLSFLVASHCGNVEYLKSFADKDLLSHIRDHYYFAFQIAARNNQVKVMKFINNFVEKNGEEKEGQKMVRTVEFLAFNWAKKNAREYLKQEYPVSYKLALEENKIKPKKKDSKWKLEIHQLDVGQGDSALVLFKKLNPETRKYEVNKSILIDGGLGYNAEYLDEYISAKIGETKSLDAVIITHFDGDHYLGIAQNMFEVVGAGKSGIKEITGAKLNHHFTKNTKFILPKVSGTKDGGGRSSEIFHDALVRYYGDEIVPGVFKNIIRGRDCINKSIWQIVGGNRSDGAPDLEIVAADDVYEIGEINLGSINDNSRSSASIIRMKGFHFYTAGDFERNSNLIQYLIRNADSEDYVPIQAFLTPHHGSSNNTISRQVMDKMGARSAIISSGSGYGHPDKPTLDGLDNSKIDFVYTTNPISSKKRKSDKFVGTGSKFENDADHKDKEPKGTITIQTYQNIAEEGKEKFIVKYQNPGSKTRDYFKDKEFGKLRDKIISTITKFDERLGTSYSKNLKEKGQIKIFLSKKNLESFLDEERKIKHLNPATLLKFVESYDAEDKETMSFLKISMKDDFIGLTIRKKNFLTLVLTKSLSIISGYNVVNEVTKLGTKLGQDKIGFFITKEEGENLRSGIFEIENLIEKRKKDNFKEGNLFVEVISPEKDKVAIGFKLWETGSVSKEYHKSQRENPDTKTHKVVARRIEYGNNNNRTIS